MSLHLRSSRLPPGQASYSVGWNVRSTIGAWVLWLYVGRWSLELYRTVPR